MTRILFIWNTEQIPIIKDEDLVILVNEKKEPELKKQGIKYKTIRDYFTFEELDELNKESIYWLKNWSNQKLHYDKNIKELFVNNETSLWWFIDFFLFYHEAHIITMKEACKFINVATKILDKEKPDCVVIYKTSHYYNELLRLISKQKNINIHDVSLGLKKRYSQWLNFKKPYILEYCKGKKFFLRWLFSRLYRIKPWKKDKTIIFGTFHSTWRKEYSIKEGTARNRDTMVSDIIDKAKEQGYNPLLIDIDYTRSKSFSSIKEKKDLGNPFEYYATLKDYLSSKKESKRLWKVYTRAREDILNSFNFKGIPLRTVFDQKFDFMAKHRFREAVMNMRVWENIIYIEKPISLLALDEAGMFGRSAVVAGHRKNVKTVGMQHGIVGDNSYEYLNVEGEIGDWKIPNSPLPDISSTYGEITRDFLIKHCGYNSKKIHVTGQPRYDIMAWIKDNFNKEKLLEQLGLPKDKKVIFFASQPIPGNEKITYELMKALKEIPNTFLVIKFHPREYDLAFYNEYAKEHGIDLKLFKANLYELLFCSDLLITKNSTVALEAMMLDIPVITTNLVGLPDIFPFSKYDSTLQVDDPKLYKESISSLLFQNDKIAELLQKQGNFLYNYAYKIDGKAAERVLNILK